MPITKNDLENAKQDDRKREESKALNQINEQIRIQNEAPRKALSDAFDFVKGKASELGDNVSKYAKEYGEVYKKGLGLKKGGKISLKDCKVNTADTKNSKHKNCW